MTSDEYYNLGNECRREGKWHEAIGNYAESIALDANSPAVVAKEMLEDILNYYNKDAYNP